MSWYLQVTLTVATWVLLGFVVMVIDKKWLGK
jgi:hypothetical protein